MNKILRFPQSFLWGSATSAYQVEGGIENCDLSEIYPAEKAGNHYYLYEKDFDLLKSLNQNAYRFSIEWSRIEPEENKFNQKEIEHYRKVLLNLKEKNIKTMVTLHHFTNPWWLAKIGGWENKRVVFYFSRFAERIFNKYQDLVDFWITINEPQIYNLASHLEKKWPPQKRIFFPFLKVLKNQISAHKKIYQIFHKLNQDVKVGNAENYYFLKPDNPESLLDRFSTKLACYFWNEFYLNRIKKYLDFIGVNYYRHFKIKFPFSKIEEKKNSSDIGWGIYPQGIYQVLKELKKYNLPIYITENGLADAKDKLRKDFIKNHLYWVWRAIEEGIDVRGYFHWSLLDNFEWDKGFEPRFGLIEIDYKTMERKIRPSANYYSQISKNNGFNF